MIDCMSGAENTPMLLHFNFTTTTITATPAITFNCTIIHAVSNLY